MVSGSLLLDLILPPRCNRKMRSDAERTVTSGMSVEPCQHMFAMRFIAHVEGDVSYHFLCGRRR